MYIKKPAKSFPRFRPIHEDQTCPSKSGATVPLNSRIFGDRPQTIKVLDIKGLLVEEHIIEIPLKLYQFSVGLET
jgi:hypothetical protein